MRWNSTQNKNQNRQHHWLVCMFIINLSMKIQWFLFHARLYCSENLCTPKDAMINELINNFADQTKWHRAHLSSDTYLGRLLGVLSVWFLPKLIKPHDNSFVTYFITCMTILQSVHCGFYAHTDLFNCCFFLTTIYFFYWLQNLRLDDKCQTFRIIRTKKFSQQIHIHVHLVAGFIIPENKSELFFDCFTLILFILPFLIS